MFLLLILALVFLLGTAAGMVAQGARIRALAARVGRLEAQCPRVFAPPPEGGSIPNSLDGLRLTLDLRQDHPHAPFATLLYDVLLREGAILGEDGLLVSGEVVSNGYADVYYRAEIAVTEGERTLFTLARTPPHGDRPENLVLELVERLKVERKKGERQRALRELP